MRFFFHTLKTGKIGISNAYQGSKLMINPEAPEVFEYRNK